MHDIVSTNKKDHVEYPLLITDILCDFEVDFSREQVERIDNGDIIGRSSLSRTGIEYDEKEKNSYQ